MNGVNIIQGKPAFSANIMAACVKKSGRYNYRVTEMTDKNCAIEFMEYMGGKWNTSGVSSFTIEDAKKAGTKNLDKFPRNMLFATGAAIIAGVIALTLLGLLGVPPDLTDLSWTRSAALIVAVVVGIGGIIVLRALHVPAVATAMIIAAGLLKEPVDWLSVFIGVLVVTVAGVAINRACGKPQALWWRPQPPGE